MSCLICTEELNIETVVNTPCNHCFCKTCFWKWTKQKNTCPICRQSLMATTEEMMELMELRNLLDHRSIIVKQVEEAYMKLEQIDHNTETLFQTKNKLAVEKASLKIDIKYCWKLSCMYVRKQTYQKI